jgi:ribosomal protein S12 methylthiotransferase accessory factor
MHVLDIGADFPIPAFAAVSRSGKSDDGLLLGFGAHLEPRIAIARALTEMNQTLLGWIAGEKQRFFVGELRENKFLAPKPETVKTCRDYSCSDCEDLQDGLSMCVELARKRGLETLVLDQTRDDVGMPCVKVIVPGLRPWWARFGPGRLYDVPVKVAWHELPLSEGELNPCHLSI